MTRQFLTLKVRVASLMPAAAMIATMMTAMSSGAAAESRAPSTASAELPQTIPGFSSIEPVAGQTETQPLPTDLDGPAPATEPSPAPGAASLHELVAAQPVGGEISPEIKCLATAIYFEARSESLPGQLAVGRVIVNCSRSGRFPGSYCGVVYQPSQFSFARMAHGGLNARLWRNAVAVAQIADSGAWQSEAEAALFFHAARVSPGWRLQKVARIDNHIFYR